MPLTYEQACLLLRDTMQKYCVNWEDEDVWDIENGDYNDRFDGRMDESYIGGYQDGHKKGCDEVARVVHAILDRLG